MTSRERQALAAVAAIVVVAALASGHTSAHGATTHTSARPDHAARIAIAYAKAQEGCPYVYGGTGPCPAGFDCSGLTQAAYASAGVYIPRTSEEDWADLPHVAASQRKAGDLVLAPGSPIDPWPGHVGMLDGRDSVIEAFATGTPVEQVSLSNFGATSGGIVGYVKVK